MARYLPDLGRNVADDVLTLKEVANYLKVTERTIYRLVAERKIPAFKVGRSWRFRLSEIDAWIKAQSHEIEPVPRQEGS
jgi:excisionase family DNA binding protein